MKKITTLLLTVLCFLNIAAAAFGSDNLILMQDLPGVVIGFFYTENNRLYFTDFRSIDNSSARLLCYDPKSANKLLMSEDVILSNLDNEIILIDNVPYEYAYLDTKMTPVTNYKTKGGAEPICIAPESFFDDKNPSYCLDLEGEMENGVFTYILGYENQNEDMRNLCRLDLSTKEFKTKKISGNLYGFANYDANNSLYWEPYCNDNDESVLNIYMLDWSTMNSKLMASFFLPSSICYDRKNDRMLYISGVENKDKYLYQYTWDGVHMPLLNGEPINELEGDMDIWLDQRGFMLGDDFVTFYLPGPKSGDKLTGGIIAIDTKEGI